MAAPFIRRETTIVAEARDTYPPGPGLESPAWARCTSYGDMAARHVARARKMVDRGEPGEAAGFLLETAKVYATLDLAAAIRESRRP
jgi:hypothetical protein